MRGAALIGATKRGTPRIVPETAIAGQRILDDLEGNSCRGFAG
jgi:hypothetical protein